MHRAYLILLLTIAPFIQGAHAQHNICVDNYILELRNNKNKHTPFHCELDQNTFFALWEVVSQLQKSDPVIAKLCFIQALEIEPVNYSLCFQYGEFLIDQKNLQDALTQFNRISDSSLYYGYAVLRKTQIFIWLDDFERALQLLNEDVLDDIKFHEAKGKLLEQIKLNTSPFLNYQTEFLNDTQPLNLLQNEWRFSQYISKYSTVELCYKNTLSIENDPLNHNDLYFHNQSKIPKLRLNTDLGMGIVTNNRGLLNFTFNTTLSFQLRQQIKAKTNIHKDYFYRTISATSAPFAFWRFKEEFEIQDFKKLSGNTIIELLYNPENNNQLFSIQTWSLYRLLDDQSFQLKMGLFYGLSQSNTIFFESLLNLEAIIASGSYENIKGYYPTWFTPNNMQLGGLVCTTEIQIAKKLKCITSVAFGVGQQEAPYLLLTDNNQLQLAFFRNRFYPANLQMQLGYNLNNRNSIDFKFIYLNTAFYSSKTALCSYHLKLKK